MDTTIPPTIPVTRPANNGAPEAKAIPKHKGRATRNTTILEGKSCFKFFFNIYFFTSNLEKIELPFCIKLRFNSNKLIQKKA
ncbi:hypothetical protein D3C85_1465990 [compost metagenome]